MIFILLLPFVLISFCQCFIRSHILREKVNPNIFSKHNSSNGRVSYLSRAHKQASHTVVFAIAQLNMDKLTAVLDDVSNPSSKNTMASTGQRKRSLNSQQMKRATRQLCNIFNLGKVLQ